MCEVGFKAPFAVDLRGRKNYQGRGDNTTVVPQTPLFYVTALPPTTRSMGGIISLRGFKNCTRSRNDLYVKDNSSIISYLFRKFESYV